MADIDSIYCPKCQSFTNLITRARAENNSDNLISEIGECNRCAQRFLVTRFGGNIIEMSPKALPRPIPDAVPSPIHEDMVEAEACFAIGAYRATATMARRALQNVCLEKGAPKTRLLTKNGKDKEIKVDLVYQIDWLYDQHIITTQLRDWAHEVRSIGNSGAHPADVDDVNAVMLKDAEDILALVKGFTDVLYVADEIYQARKADAAA